MKSGKTIDISKSSLVSLKAELSRKQEEVRQAKGSESYIKLPPKPKENVKTNKGVDERDRKDLELLPEEVDLLKKSREVLEVKARLYDELHKGTLVPEEGKETYLVDFKHKEAPSASGLGESQSKSSGPQVSEKDNDDSESMDDEDWDDSEWVEYTDCLGRTRTCHRSELAEMKERDRKMSRELIKKKESAPGGSSQANPDEGGPGLERPPELLSADMERELFRKKWEQEETELLGKADIHYEDVLFDEARSHGVGYFKFSKDEEARRKEQETLRKVREETEARQKDARLLRQRRESQRQARLIAARKRQRARMGLSELSEEEILAEISTKTSEETKTEDTEEDIIGPMPPDQLESALKKAAHVRPWDVGKNPIAEPGMSQEEWVEKQRGERNSEFAPLYESGQTSAPAAPGVGFDPSRPPPLIKRRRLAPAAPQLSAEEEIEARLGRIRDQILGGRSHKS